MRVNCTRSEACDKFVKNLLTEGGWGLIFSRNHSSQPMKKILLSSLVAAAFAVGSANGQVLIGSSSGSQYTTATWTNGAPNAFAGWFFQNGGGGALNNISDSTQNGRTSIGAQSFFIVGGTNNSFIDVFAPLGGSLSSGQGISLNANYSWNNGTRGIEFEQAFGAGGLFRFEHGGGDALRFGVGTNATVIFANAFNQAFTYNVSFFSTNQLSVSASLFGNSTPFFSTNLTVAAMPNQVKFYTGGYSGGANQNNFGLYFNNLTTVPEPSTYALLALSAAGLAGYTARRRARK
jgi:PEP-CTERM motif